MHSENFQLLDYEPIDNSIIKRDFTKIYDRQRNQLNQSDQKSNLFLVKTTIIIR